MLMSGKEGCLIKVNFSRFLLIEYNLWRCVFSRGESASDLWRYVILKRRCVSNRIISSSPDRPSNRVSFHQHCSLSCTAKVVLKVILFGFQAVRRLRLLGKSTFKGVKVSRKILRNWSILRLANTNLIALIAHLRPMLLLSSPKNSLIYTLRHLLPILIGKTLLQPSRIVYHNDCIVWKTALFLIWLLSVILVVVCVRVLLHVHHATLPAYSRLGSMILSKHKGDVLWRYRPHRTALVHLVWGLVRHRSSTHHIVLAHFQSIKRVIVIIALQVLWLVDPTHWIHLLQTFIRLKRGWDRKVVNAHLAALYGLVLVWTDARWLHKTLRGDASMVRWLWSWNVTWISASLHMRPHLMHIEQVFEFARNLNYPRWRVTIKRLCQCCTCSLQQLRKTVHVLCEIVRLLLLNWLQVLEGGSSRRHITIFGVLFLNGSVDG